MISMVYDTVQRFFGKGGISRVALGKGVGNGKDGWRIALKEALKSNDISGASRAMVFFNTSGDTPLDCMSECVDELKKHFSEENICIEIDVLDELVDEFQIIIIATGF